MSRADLGLIYYEKVYRIFFILLLTIGFTGFDGETGVKC